MGTRFALHGEAVVGGPVQYGLSTAPQNGDVERFYPHLLQHLYRACGRGGVQCTRKEYRFGVGFAEEALQRPGAALLDLERYRWQGYDPAQLGDVTLIGKAGHIAFNTGMPRNQR